VKNLVVRNEMVGATEKISLELSFSTNLSNVTDTRIVPVKHNVFDKLVWDLMHQ